jgi:ATP-dependent DNA helicase RecQ
MNIFQALKNYFGYDNFRPGQEEIIRSILKGDNVLAILPTGGGKSICFQIPSLISDKFSIVISPLISLMKDQVDALNEKEIIASFINSTMSFQEAEQVLSNVYYGKIKLLYLAPERLNNIQFAERIKSLNPEYLFIDEAHCISEWGHNFRPSYTKIKDFIAFTGIKKISAFTATATPEVRNDIINQLNLSDPKIFVRGFERPNLHLNVLISSRKKEKLLQILSQHKTPAIVYCSSRKKTEEVAEFLYTAGVKCDFYHAGLSPIQRKKIQEDFINDKLQVISATNAFGMGIDKSNIRLIIHFNTPGSIENYYQEIGRAGRDGNPAYAFLLHEDADIQIQNYFIANSCPDKDLIQKIYDAICDFGRIGLGSFSERDIPLNKDFISAVVKKEVNAGLLHSTIKLLESAGYWKLVSAFEKKDGIQFLYNKNQLKNFVKISDDNELKELIIFLVREYGAEIFSKKVKLSVKEIAEKIGSNEEIIYNLLNMIASSGIVDFDKAIFSESVTLLHPRVKSSELRLNYKRINETYLNLQRKVDQMIDFVYSTECRMKFILNYFGENADSYSCGNCDRCKSRLTMPDEISEYLKELIVSTISESNEKISETSIVNILKGSVKKDSYKKFSRFGSAKTYSSTEIKMVISNLISQEIIEKIGSGKRNLILSDKPERSLNTKDSFLNQKKSDNDYSNNLELFNLLRERRSSVSKKFRQTPALICPDEVLIKIAETKPLTKADLLSIDGFTERMFTKVGQEFLNILNEFNDQISELKKTGAGKKEIPKNLSETLSLLKKGYKLQEIAEIRKLTEAVISMQVETIIEYEPSTDITGLFNNGELEVINQVISNGFADIKDIKSKLPDNFSYAMIRIAIAKQKADSILKNS